MVIITSFRAPESPVQLTQPNVIVILDKRELGIGTLFVSERTLSWQKDGSNGFSLEYFNITLHAISKDLNLYSRECIYLLTDSHMTLEGAAPNTQGDNESDSDEDSEPDLSELIFVPENPNFIQPIYDSIKLCQELNPDPADSDDDEDDNIYADAEEEMFIEAESDPIIDDNDVNNLAQRLQNHRVNVEVNYRNGNSGYNDEEFEDAD